MKALCWLILVLPPATALGQLDVFSSRSPLNIAAPAARATLLERGTTTPHPAVARIVAPERDSISLGSGTLVAVDGDRGLVLTNWHVVRDAAGAVQVLFPDGFRTAGRVLRVDADWDLAAIEIDRPRVSPVRLADDAPRRGDRLTIAGYGPGTYRAASGQCIQFLSPGGSLPFEIVELSVAARQGDSGGPMLNSRGELAGVLFGSTSNATSGSHIGRVRQFLDTVAFGSALEETTMIASHSPPVRLPAVGGGQWKAKATATDDLGQAIEPGIPPDAEEETHEEFAANAAVEEPLSDATGENEAADAVAMADESGSDIDDEDPAADSLAEGYDAETAPHYAPLPRYADAREFTRDEDDEAPLPLQAAIGCPPPELTRDLEPTNDTAQQPTDSPDTSVEVASADALTWQELAGESLVDQFKSAFAVLGMIGLALHSLRWFRVL